jgi:hypothetical protein
MDSRYENLQPARIRKLGYVLLGMFAVLMLANNRAIYPVLLAGVPSNWYQAIFAAMCGVIIAQFSLLAVWSVLSPVVARWYHSRHIWWITIFSVVTAGKHLDLYHSPGLHYDGNCDRNRDRAVAGVSTCKAVSEKGKGTGQMSCPVINWIPDIPARLAIAPVVRRLVRQSVSVSRSVSVGYQFQR